MNTPGTLMRGDEVFLTEEGIKWMVSNPKLHSRWRERRGVVERYCRNGWRRVRWDGNKSSNEAMPAKFLRPAQTGDQV